MSVTRDSILDSLAELGIERGHSIFVHSSLSSFGYVEGGAKTVCLALIDAVGPGGTVLMPAFTFRFIDMTAPVLDLEHEPSCVGRISEVFRSEFATHRSRHLTHSVSAAGADAEYFTSAHCGTPFNERGAFRKLADRDGMVLLIAVDYNRCTFFHAIESALPVPYLGMVPKPAALSIVGNGLK